MFALVSIQARFNEGQNLSDSRSPHPGWWWQKGRLAFVEWLTEPISFPGKWPTCKLPEQRYNGDNETMLPSSKKSIANVR